MARIIEYRLLCIKSLVTVDITAVSNDAVRVTIGVERVIKNVSAETQKVRNNLELDEWGFIGFSSAIDFCRLTVGMAAPKEITELKGPPQDDALRAYTDQIDLRRDETVTLTSRGSEIRRINDHWIMSFRVPTVNPRVRVTTSRGIHTPGCTFGVPGERVTKSSISDEYELEGTQFPGQHTRVRWYPDAGISAEDAAQFKY